MIRYVAIVLSSIGAMFLWGLVFGDQDYCGRVGFVTGLVAAFATFVYRNRKWLG